jgi:3-hydroxyanthranilate 3,4-dioxygenase
MNEMPKIPKVQMPIVSLADQMQQLADTGKRVSVLWQEDDTLAFVARGREYRSEFHINPSDEVMYPI